MSPPRPEAPRPFLGLLSTRSRKSRRGAGVGLSDAASAASGAGDLAAACTEGLLRLAESATSEEAALALLHLARCLRPGARAGLFVRGAQGWRAAGGDLLSRRGRAFPVGPAGEAWAELRIVGPLSEPAAAVLQAVAALVPRWGVDLPHAPAGGYGTVGDAEQGLPLAVARAVALASDFASALRALAEVLAAGLGASRAAVLWSGADVRESAVVQPGATDARQRLRWSARALEALETLDQDGVHRYRGKADAGLGPLVVWRRSSNDSWRVSAALGYGSPAEANRTAARARRVWQAADGLFIELLEHAWLTDWARERAEWQHRVDHLAAARRLAADAAHEIRNPLAAARGYLQLIGRHSQEPSVGRYIEAATGEIDRIDRIVREFLMFARPVQVESGRVQVTEVLADAAEALLAEADAQRVNVTVDSPADLPAVYGVAERLRQLFMNLGRNALQAMLRGGRLSIHARSADGCRNVVIRFRDTGPGLPAELGDRIFEAFVTTRPEGTGLGLPVCQAIAREHGGDIQAANHPEGGAEFVVTLRADRRREGSPASR